jgi:hypothetical protein
MRRGDKYNRHGVADIQPALAGYDKIKKTK